MKKRMLNESMRFLLEMLIINQSWMPDDDLWWGKFRGAQMKSMDTTNTNAAPTTRTFRESVRPMSASLR